MKAVLVNLGCKVNKYELDSIATILINNDYEVSYNHEYADIYIVNTCAVTNESEKKSRQYISKILKLNKDAKIIVMGCASQNNIEQFTKFPNVYSAIGIENKQDIISLINNSTYNVYDSTLNYNSIINPTVNKTRAFLKVQDGCNNFCSYCLIPYLRGRSRSRDLNEVVIEAQNLAKTVKEIVVVGIDLSSYKTKDNLGLGDLLFALKDIDARIRIGSLEVNVITKEFLEKIKTIPNLCPHFHLSMQSGCNSILKKMNRHYTKEIYLEKCNMLREYFPNCNITTDVIVGFSDETEEEFEETIQTVKKAKFGNIHIFPYSPRKGTVAYKFNNITNDLRHKRVDILEKIRDELKNEYIASLNGTYSLLIEEIVGEYATGYTENYVKVYLKNDNYSLNEFVNVKIKEPFLDGAKAIKA